MVASARRRNFEFTAANSRKRNSYHFDFSTCVPYSGTIGVSKAFVWFTQHPQESKQLFNRAVQF
jgi:hypothetical protein